MSVFHPMILNDPAIWSLPAAEFKLYAALLVFVKPDGSGAFPTNETLAEMVDVNERSIRRLLGELESKGIIQRTQIEKRDGTFLRTITVNYVPVIGKGRASVSKSWNPEQEVEVMDNHPPVTDDLGGRLRATGGGRLPVTAEHSHREHTHLNNDDGGGRRTPSAESGGGEPFELPESANVASLPKVGHLPLRPSLADRPTRVPVQVPQDLRDRIYTTLGTYGDLFVANLTQEMVDRDGYVVDVLRSCQSGRKPIALALKILKDFGNWVSPVERHEADKKLREEIFWRRMGVSK